MVEQTWDDALKTTFNIPGLGKAAGAVALAAFCYAGAAQAADEVLHEKLDHEAVFSGSFENDVFAGSDANYTNGVRFAFLSAENNVPDWVVKSAHTLPFFASEGHKRWGFALGQNMYAPTDITAFNLQVDDRPYAGWTYGTIGMITDTGYRLDNLQLSVGIVGPGAFAGETQSFVHRVIDSPHPNGWQNQLENELGVMLTYERKWRSLYQLSPFGMGVDFTPSVGGSLGNVATYASAGAVVRLGYDLPADYGPPMIRPSLPGSDFFVPSKDFGWYVFAGLDGRAVARDIFLDGNTFQDSHSVDKELLVGGLQMGLAVTVNDIRVAYTHVFRTLEFEGQKEPEAFGALTVSARF